MSNAHDKSPQSTWYPLVGSTTFRSQSSTWLLKSSFYSCLFPLGFNAGYTLYLCPNNVSNIEISRMDQEGSHHTWPNYEQQEYQIPVPRGNKIFFFLLKHNCVLSVPCNWMIMRKMFALSAGEGHRPILIPIGHMIPWATKEKGSCKV